MKTMIDGYPCEVDETTAVAVNKVQSALTNAHAEIAQLRSATPKVKLGDKDLTAQDVQVLLTAKDAQITALEKERATPEAIKRAVGELVKVRQSVADMQPDFQLNDDMDAHQIRVGLLTKLATSDEYVKTMLTPLLAGKTLADAEPSSVAVAFDTIGTALKGRKKVSTYDQHIGHALAYGGNRNGADKGDDLDGRDAYMAQQDAWRTSRAEEKKT